MRRISLWSVGVAFVGSIVVAACVGDDPAAAPSGTAKQGSIGEPCFANGTCSDGLSCSLVQGTAKCVPAADAAAADDASSGGDSSTVVTDSGPAPCLFTPTTFPCSGQQPFACYGAAQACTATGCNPTDLSWECFSRRQCNDVAPCCVTSANATFTAAAGCAQGTLQMSATATSGATCSTSLACGPGDTRLCQADSHCPAGQRCVPIKITGGGAAMDGKVFIGACAPL